IDVVQDASGTCDHGAGRVDTRDLHRADPVLPADLGHRVAAEEGDPMARQQARVLGALGDLRGTRAAEAPPGSQPVRSVDSQIAATRAPVWRTVAAAAIRKGPVPASSTR